MVLPKLEKILVVDGHANVTVYSFENCFKTLGVRTLRDVLIKMEE